MSDKEFAVGDRYVVFNGGDPLPGSPESFNEAHEWADRANESKSENEEPTWRFDCGFKLDFDGPLLQILSRFYPPANYYGPRWDGKVKLLLFDKEIKTKEFEADTLDELRAQVEKYVQGLRDELENLVREEAKGAGE